MVFLNRFKAVIGFALFLFAVFWIPKDVIDWEQAAAPWWDILAMVDQNTALWAFAVMALIYICWIDIRPLLREWMGWSTRKTNRWRPRQQPRFKSLRRLVFPVTFEYGSILRMNSRQNAAFIDFSVYAIRVTGRNNRNREMHLKGKLRVEDRGIDLPIFFHVRGENRTATGQAIIRPFEEFDAYASLSDPEGGQLICDNRVSDALFLRDYAPFIIEIECNSKTYRRRLSFSRVKAEIDGERDRILFYEPGKHD